MYCPECGKQIPDDSIFCPECGCKLSAPETPAAGKNRYESVPEEAGKTNSKKGTKKKGLPAWLVIAVILIAGVLIVRPYLKGKGNGDRPDPTYETKDNGYFHTLAEEASGPETSVPASEEPAQEVSERETDENGLIDLSDEEVADMLVRFLSTDDYAKAQDFEWFLDCELSDGSGAGQIIRKPGAVERIQGDEAHFLNGGWKAFMLDTQSVPADPNSGRFFNVNIDTDGSSFDVTMNWKYLILPYSDETVEEEGSDLFKGRWDGKTASAACQSEFGTVSFEQFYIAPDYSAEYAVGTFSWISGEVERIALMRTDSGQRYQDGQ